MDLIPAEVRNLLYSVARIVLIGRRGTIFEQVSRIEETKLPVLFRPPHPPAVTATPVVTRPRPQLDFFNGMGGFADKGREYVTILDQSRYTPAPWINVVANKEFGFQVSTDGAGYTWALNSQQNRLTPWSNDPVADPPGKQSSSAMRTTICGPDRAPVRSRAPPHRAPRPGLFAL